MVNTPKKTLGEYTFDEVGTFSVEQLAGVPLDRQFSPFDNTDKVSFAELWSTITTTWASETRTWVECASLIANEVIKNLGSYTFDEIGTFSLDQVGGVAFERQFSPITNTPKT